MKRILILLLIQILPAHCLATTTNNDSFKMYIEAISLKDTNIKTYIIYDGTNDMKEKYKSSDINAKYIYSPEVSTYLENELEKQNYKVYNSKKIDESNIFKAGKISLVGLYYYTIKNSIIYEKYIHIRSIKLNNNFETIPTWSVMLFVPDESSNFQYYIPSMIKCAGKYFNKNFKGIVTCKR